MVRRGICETLGTEKDGVERIPRLAIGRGVPSAVRTLTGESRVEEKTTRKNQKTYEKKLQNPEPMGMYLTV